MKLPDFTRDPALTKLKRHMGLDSLALGTAPSKDRSRLSTSDDTALRSGEGLAIDPHDLTIQENGTFTFRGIPVVVYIRDVAAYGREPHVPRYHLADCATLAGMRRIGRLERYVISAEPQGRFRINVIRNNRPDPRLLSLAVCQNCLARLQWQSFSFQLTPDRRAEIVATFKPGQFFAGNRGQRLSEIPSHDAKSAPLNVYPASFRATATRLKTARNWTCEACGLRSTGEKRRLMHAHHRNGVKSDCRAKNLRLLCASCHKRQPLHGHLRKE